MLLTFISILRTDLRNDFNVLAAFFVSHRSHVTVFRTAMLKFVIILSSEKGNFITASKQTW